LVHLDSYVSVSKPLRKLRSFPKKVSSKRLKKETVETKAPVTSKHTPIEHSRKKGNNAKSNAVKIPTGPREAINSSSSTTRKKDHPEEYEIIKAANEQLLYQNEMLSQRLQHLEQLLFKSNSHTTTVADSPGKSRPEFTSLQIDLPPSTETTLKSKESSAFRTANVESPEEAMMKLLSLVENSVSAFGHIVEKISAVESHSKVKKLTKLTPPPPLPGQPHSQAEAAYAEILALL
jgi:hypothetical protein